MGNSEWGFAFVVLQVVPALAFLTHSRILVQTRGVGWQQLTQNIRNSIITIFASLTLISGRVHRASLNSINLNTLSRLNKLGSSNIALFAHTIKSLTISETVAYFAMSNTFSSLQVVLVLTYLTSIGSGTVSETVGLSAQSTHSIRQIHSRLTQRTRKRSTTTTRSDVSHTILHFLQTLKTIRSSQHTIRTQLALLLVSLIHRTTLHNLCSFSTLVQSTQIEPIQTLLTPTGISSTIIQQTVLNNSHFYTRRVCL